MKKFNGKAIYCPSGKAGEYAEYACNFYNGCSNGCEYCYCKKGVLSHTLGGDTPTLKKCFRDEYHALEVFEKEFNANLQELQKHGLFFSFTTDPMLPGTIWITFQAIARCLNNGVPVKILTKCAEWIKTQYWQHLISFEDFDGRKNIAIGFTLTGHDELEQGASTNSERIEAMKKLHAAGFKTFASIEPIIDCRSSLRMISNSINCCDLYKIGLMSGRKYEKNELHDMMKELFDVWTIQERQSKIYFKDSFLEKADIYRGTLPFFCVDRDYDIFNRK